MMLNLASVNFSSSFLVVECCIVNNSRKKFNYRSIQVWIKQLNESMAKTATESLTT